MILEYSSVLECFLSCFCLWVQLPVFIKNMSYCRLFSGKRSLRLNNLFYFLENSCSLFLFHGFLSSNLLWSFFIHSSILYFFFFHSVFSLYYNFRNFWWRSFKIHWFFPWTYSVSMEPERSSCHYSWSLFFLNSKLLFFLPLKLLLHSCS